VQKLLYKTVSITNSPVQTKRTSINHTPGTLTTRQIRHQINEDLTTEPRMRISTKVQIILIIVPCSNRTSTETYPNFERPKTFKYQNQQTLNERFTTDTSIKKN
jgi:hypothetical protein